MDPNSSPAEQKKRRPIGWGLVAALVCVILIKRFVDSRDESINRAEFVLVNESPLPISAKYQGYYSSAESQLAPKGKWQQRFRAGDNLVVETTFQGRALANRVTLFGAAEHSFPGRPAYGEIYLMRRSTNAGGHRVSTAIHWLPEETDSSVGEPELNVSWGLARP